MSTPGKYEASHTYSASEALAAAREARMRILLSAQEYGISGRVQKMADLAAVNATIKELQKEVAAESGRSAMVLGRRVGS